MSEWADRVWGIAGGKNYTSKKQLALDAGINHHTFASWFKDKKGKKGKTEPTIPTKDLWKLADPLGVSLLEVLPKDVLELECFQRVIDDVRREAKKPVEKTVGDAVERARLVLTAALYDVTKVVTDIKGRSDVETT